MHHITRRLSPSLILALVALFVALAGTAAAAVIIDDPAELGDNVVTGRAIDGSTIVSSDIKQESIHDNDLADPQLKVRVLGSDSITQALSGSDGTVKRVNPGDYEVKFSTSALNANEDETGTDTVLNSNCAFTATPKDEAAIMLIQSQVTSQPDAVRVRAFHPGTLQPENTSFDIIASC